jgi:hypothetical protein
MKKFRAASWITLVMAVFFLWSCGGGGSGGSVSGSGGAGGGTGTLSLGLVDAPGGNYKAVYVTIGQVQVCKETGLCDGAGEGYDCECQWETIATVNRTYNLLELVNGVIEDLGQKDIAAGTYHQMRLKLFDMQDNTLNILGNPHPYPQYLIDENDEAYAMKVPSGYQSGIKLVHSFEIESGGITELILDFDVARSVVKAGNKHKYILKPTIKVIDTYNRATVSGTVTTDETTRAMVAAWHEDSANDWGLATSTVTDEMDDYTLHLRVDIDEYFEPLPTVYRIVATADGFEPACEILTVNAGGDYPDTDFVLTELTAEETAVVSGFITGTAPVINGDYPVDAPEITVGFSLKDGTPCFDGLVETAFVMTTDDGDASTDDVFYDSQDGSFQYQYTIELPAGTYNVTASGDGLVPVTVPDIEAEGAANSVLGPINLVPIQN